MKRKSVGLSSMWRLLCLFLAILLLVFGGILLYGTALKKTLTETVEQTLDETLRQYQFSFNSAMNSEMKMLKNIAHSVGYLPDNKTTVLSFLREKTELTDFTYISVVGMDGRGVANTGKIIDFSGYGYFEKARQGKTVFWGPVRSSIDGSEVNPVATPVLVNGEIQGVLVGSYSKKALDALLLPSFEGDGYAFAIDKLGNIMLSSQNDHTYTTGDNLFRSWEGVTFAHDYTLQAILDDIALRETGHTQYIVDGVLRYAHYAPLAQNGWYIVAVVPEMVVKQDTELLMRYTILLATVVMLCFILFILYTLHIQHKANKQKQQHIQELEQAAYYDELTGLPNTRKFKQEAAAAVLENPTTTFVMAKLDIANFKMVNEMFDHETGDVIVRCVAQLIAGLREQMELTKGSFARINADEFLIMDVYTGSQEELLTRSLAFETAFHDRMREVLGSHKIEFRYGQYLMEPGECDIGACIEKVYLAHRRAKSIKGRKVYCYDKKLKEMAIRDIEMENQMEEALQNGEFVLYLQPKYALKNNTIAGAEALVRWKKPGGSLIPPGDFIPLFERNGFVVTLDMYMLRQACALLAAWQENGQEMVPISVNFSRLHLTNPHFVEEICAIVDEYHLDHCYIEIELTETTILNNAEVWEVISHSLHAAGFRLAMDDFGAG